ncbi:DUF5405 family protein [Oceanimonas baumannii]|uniref:DUF5405 domain-containing protein n=1 Tax=Oceanimonas baumannii TaxID=129578 RepID=A0A235CJK6_9GAMM|nr:DUF5405 family protein [Oceanimonas baumannii]OYD24712.1 hypothetical protein B6S09_08800 [Oceanimonas baumannii]TDW59458.1 hypothetical protein LY04_01709 [Oceanimonas baumannii]
MSINIQINEKYIITSDNLQFILNQVAVKGDNSNQAGETYLKAVGYYHSIDLLVKALMQRELRQSDATTLQQCQQIIADTAAACLQAFKVGMKPLAFVGFDPGEDMSEEERHRIEKALEESQRHLFTAESHLVRMGVAKG